MAANDSAAVRTEGVWKTFHQEAEEVHAVRDVSLTVERGEFTALAGPSGSGKTTLLNLIGGLTRPSQGQVWVAGREVSEMSNQELARLRLQEVGFVFQAYNLMPVLTAYENAEMVLWVQGVDGKTRRERVMGLLEQVGLKGMEDRRPSELSGGQQQRVAIARAIASNPAVVLADEPTANVDSETAETLLGLMEELNREQGVTFLFSTHDPQVMERARRVVRLVDGNVASDERR